METALSFFAIGFCGAIAIGILGLVAAQLAVSFFDFFDRRNHGHD